MRDLPPCRAGRALALLGVAALALLRACAAQHLQGASDVAAVPIVTGRGAGSATLTGVASPPPAASAEPWELALEPAVRALYGPHDPNTTVLRGPPRLVGTYRGAWLKAHYGAALAAEGFLTSDRGVIIMQLPEEQQHSAAAAVAAATAAAAGANERPREPLPGGVQDVRGDLILRDGRSITDRDIRFALRGLYVAAAGRLVGVLESSLPIALPLGEGEDEAASGGTYREALRSAARHVAINAGWARAFVRASPPPPPAAKGAAARRRRHVDVPTAAPAAPVGAAAETAAAGGAGAGAATATASSAGAGTGVSSGGGGVVAGARRALAALGAAARLAAASATAPPSPPLELALHKTCEFRISLQVYYQGDPDAQSHIEHLRLHEHAPPPPLVPPRQRSAWSRFAAQGGGGGGGGGEAAPGAEATAPAPAPAGFATAAAAAAATAPSSAAAAHRPDGAAANGTAHAKRHLQRRRLAADTEMYHTTQMQLHGAAYSMAADDGDEARGGGNGGAGEAPEAAVYGIPPGMDPADPDLVLVGEVSSPNCQLTLSFNASSVHLERYYRQVLRYSVLVSAITLGQMVLVVVQMESASTPSAASRMSLYGTTLQAILDAYGCLLHLTGALVVDSLFGAFAAIAFLQFLLFAVFEMRQALLVWRAQRTAGLGGAVDFWSVRRDMSAVYTRFYALMLAGLLLLYQLQSYTWFLLLALHSWWLPQLVHSAVSDTRPPLRMDYVWGMSGLRLLSPLYVYGCPHNLLRVATRPGLCAALVAWVAAQATLVSAQARWGPRVCVPRILLPRRYDYHRPATRREMGIDDPHAGAAAAAAGGGSGPGGRGTTAAAGSGGAGRGALRRLASLLPSGAWFRRPPVPAAGGGGGAAQAVQGPSGGGGGGGARWLHRGSGGGAGEGGDVETGHGSKECVICMNPVPLLPLTARMVTPCGHFFHEHCLKRWMDVKMDCPTCRRPLPPT